MFAKVTVTSITDRERILDKELFWKEVGRAWELSVATGGHPNVQNSSDDYLLFIFLFCSTNRYLIAFSATTSLKATLCCCGVSRFAWASDVQTIESTLTWKRLLNANRMVKIYAHIPFHGSVAVWNMCKEKWNKRQK